MRTEGLGAYFPKGGAVSSFMTQGGYSWGITHPGYNFKAGGTCLKHLPTSLSALPKSSSPLLHLQVSKSSDYGPYGFFFLFLHSFHPSRLPFLQCNGF